MGRTADRKRRGRRACLAAALSTLLSLITAEAASRALFGTPLRERLPIVLVRANPERGYEMVPDTDHFTYEHPVHVGHLGLRGRDLPVKEGREVRVLCLGDSLTYGQGVPDADTIPARLEAELAPAAEDAGRTVRVMNGGVRGYGTREELALLEQLGGAIQPDLVVLFWYPNDLERSDIEANYRRLLASGPVAFDTGERMEGLAVLKWRARQVLRRSALLMKARDLCAELAARPLPPTAVEAGLSRLDRDLARFGEYVRAREIPLVVALIPTSTALGEGSVEDDLRGRVAALARAHGFPVVDLAPELRALREPGGELPVLPYDGHYDGRANAAIARRITPVLRELLPARL